MDTNDVVDIGLIDAIPQQRQVQCGVDEQLAVLFMVANRLGLYDAADNIRSQLQRRGRQFIAQGY
jgi:hypothetical protein